LGRDPASQRFQPAGRLSGVDEDRSGDVVVVYPFAKSTSPGSLRLP
jgi:hypothetical protein